MADESKTLAVPRSRFHFWYFGVVRLLIGLAQIVAVIWCAVLLLEYGFSARTMRAVFVGAGITTLSLLLFRIVGRQREALSHSEASDWTHGENWELRDSANSKN